jgi:hypothetical protein
MNRRQRKSSTSPYESITIIVCGAARRSLLRHGIGDIAPVRIAEIRRRNTDAANETAGNELHPLSRGGGVMPWQADCSRKRYNHTKPTERRLQAY